MQLRIEELSPEAFAPYGIVLQKPDRPADAGGNGWKWWGENAFLPADQRPYGIGILELKPAKLQFDWAEQHMHSQELIIPTSVECLVYVGPPDNAEEPAGLQHLEDFKVFRVKAGQAVLLKEAAWHGAPLATDQPLNVLVLLLCNTGKEDVFIHHFENSPVEIVS